MFSSQTARKAYTNEVLLDLYEHYKDFSADYATGLDKLITLVEEFHVCLASILEATESFTHLRALFQKVYMAYSEVMTIIDLYCPERDLYTNFSCLTGFRRRKRIDDLLPLDGSLPC